MADEPINLAEMRISAHVAERYKKYYARRHREGITIITDKIFRSVLSQAKPLPVTKLRNWKRRLREYPASIYYLIEAENIVFAIDTESRTITTCFPFVGKGASRDKPKTRQSRAKEKMGWRKQVESHL